MSENLKANKNGTEIQKGLPTLLATLKVASVNLME